MEEFKFGVWYPFDTAPKDGTVILAILEDATIPSLIRFVDNEYLSNKWTSYWSSHVFRTGKLFTHWMPLPPAPSE